METPMMLDPSTVALPAPDWFIQFFKWLGFTLHLVPMNLWYAGMLVALCLHFGGGQYARLFASRLLRAMPVIVALGVNFGVVPLLFIQVAYFKVFYPATILMAWYWLAIVGLLIPAYYGVYAYAWGLRNDSKPLAGWRIAAGWIAAMFFLAIGFIFSNGLSLMDHLERWPALWNAHQMSGAALGTAMNWSDPTLWPRWLLMFGLALCTTAAWVLVDAFFLAARTTEDAYRQWAAGYAKQLYTFGMLWTAMAGGWYVFLTWSDTLREQMFHGPLLALTVVTAIAPGLPWLLTLKAKTRTAAALVAVGQFGVLAVNAASRQVVQNLNLKERSFDVSAQPIDVQWSPMAMFLIVFVMGTVVVGWILWQAITSDEKRKPTLPL